jgi:hypothetical protein
MKGKLETWELLGMVACTGVFFIHMHAAIFISIWFAAVMFVTRSGKEKAGD